MSRHRGRAVIRPRIDCDDPATLEVRPHDGDYHFYTAAQAAGLLTAVGFEVTRRESGFGALLVITVRR